MCLFSMAKNLHYLLADSLRATGDHNKIIGIVDRITSPFVMVTDVAIKATIDGTKQNEDPGVPDPLVLAS